METASIPSAPQQKAITAADCYCWIAYCGAAVVGSLPIALHSNKPIASVIVLSAAVITTPCLLLLYRIRHKGPVVVPAITFLTSGGFMAIFYPLYACLLALLTVCALLWSSCAILGGVALVLRFNYPTFLLVLALGATNIPLWRFTGHCWKQFVKEVRQTPTPVAVVPETIAPTAAVMPELKQTSSRHWWTNTDTHDEIKQGISQR